MIALVRINNSIEISIRGRIETLPDISIEPNRRTRKGSIPGQPAFFLDHNQNTSLWFGPYTIGAGSYYIVDSPEPTVKALRQALGLTRVQQLTRALQASAPLREWARDLGFRTVKNSNGKPVGIYPPLVIAGRQSFDLDGDDIEEAPELPDLEELNP